MKKTMMVIGILLVLVSVMGFAAGKSDSGKVTLRVFYYLEATAPNAVADANKWFGDFEKKNPGVKLERENLFDEPFHDKLRAYAAAGNLPDVMYVWPSGRSDYLHDQKLLKDLTPFINKDGIKDKYLPLTMDPSQQQAGYMAMIPQGITNTHAFFINMEVLNECGLQPAKTYADLKAQVPVLKAKGYETVIIPAQSDWVMQSCLFSMVAGRFCGEGWEKKIHAGQTKFTDPDFVNALNFIKTMYDDGVIQRSAVGIEYGEGPGLFANKKSAYYIDGDWRVGAFITDQDTKQALISPARQANIRITAFPEIAGAKLNSSSSVILGVGYAMSSAIPAGSPKEAAAWELVKWMTGKEVSQDRTERGGTPTPSRTDLDFAAMKLEPMQKAVGNLGNEFKTATVVIDGVFPSEVYNPINTGLIEIAMGRRTPQQVAADVQRAFDAWKK
ncbi:MAG: extracellular solute-binding protein [Treponema sp.]|jgi:raffinose/stachyose/melibiose transport system substrate-binding protein|nr:extracellular solute-binding protein [Treponema sp.]